MRKTPGQHFQLSEESCSPREKIEEHRILIDLVTDVLGLKEVVDRVRVDELLWEREDRSKEKAPEQVLPWEESVGTEDIVECAEEGKDFVPPSGPTPEEK